MSVPELKRCFECGATHPQSVLLCPRDGTPLCFDVVGRHWKIEGLVSRRPGGASFTAVHLESGQRGLLELLVPGESASDSPALTRFQQQLQALRMLDLNKGILKLIEEGTEERDGARFLVTDLGKLRQLGEVLAERRPEWQRPGGAQMEPTEAAHLVRPLLSVLSTAGRLGMAHGSLDMSQIYIGSETNFQSGLGMLSHVKLHGIVAVGMGPQLRDAQAADLRAIARILYELCTGKPLPEGEEVPKEPLPESLSGAVGQVVLRAIGVTGPALFASAEEMQRALSTAAPSGFTAPISVPPGLQPASAPIPPPRPRIEPALARTLPPPPSAPSLPSLPNLGASSVATTLPPVRVTSSQPPVPTPLQPVAGLPQRSGLTSELRQVSILDLMREMQQQKDAAARQETLARSRFRPSSQEIKVLPLPPPGGESGEPVADAALAPDANEGPTVVDRPRSGQSLEPTVDGPELPLRPESASSARGPAPGLDAADLGSAPSSASASAPAPSASSARAAAPASARSAASGRLAAPGLGAAPSEAPPPSAASSPRPSAASGSRLPLPSAASSPPPLPPSAASSPRPSASAQSARAAAATSSASPPRGGGVSELEDAPTEPFAPAVSAAAISAVAASAAAASAAAALAASASARAASAAAASAAAAPAAAAPAAAASAAAAPALAAPALAVPAADTPEKPPAPVAASGLAPVPRWAWFAIIAPLIAIILGLVAKILFGK